MGKKAKSKSKSLRKQPQKLQVAALPFRVIDGGDVEILLLTSRETRRFILPKGWPIKKLSDRFAAAREAYEEAGVNGKLLQKKPVGSYTYFKRRLRTFEIVKVNVYPLMVTGFLDDWPEKGQRQMAWLNPRDAAILVDEPQLAHLIGEFAQWARQHPTRGPMAPLAARAHSALPEPGLSG